MKDTVALVTLAALLATGAILTAQVPVGPAPADAEKEKAAAVDRARTFLSKRLSVPADQFTVGSADPATWPDASLGCPEKDRMYAQVMTRGFKVVLKSGDTSHEVHVAGTQAVLCERKPPK
jgi:hypothetical protein